MAGVCVRWSPVQERAQDFAVFGKDLRVYRYELKVPSFVLVCTACAEYSLYVSYVCMAQHRMHQYCPKPEMYRCIILKQELSV